MNKKETMMILSTIRAAYPNQFNRLQDEDFVSMVNIWSNLLGDCDGNDVMLAVRQYIMNDSKGFVPSIGQIRTAVFEMNTQALSTEDAWSKIKRVMSRMSYDGLEQYNQLPETVKKAIGGYNVIKSWSMMNIDIVETTIAKQFKDAYRYAAEKEKQIQMLPNNDIKQLKEKNNEQKYLDWEINEGTGDQKE